MKANDIAKKILLWIVFILVAIAAVATLFPIYWLITSSVKAYDAIISAPPQWVPMHPTLDNFSFLLREFPILRWTFNSALSSAIALFCATLFNTFAAYVFAKKRFPGSKALFAATVSLLMVPVYIVVIPLFIMMNNLHLTNTYPGLILPWLAGPFGIFMLKGFIQTVPTELIDAAKLDGYSDFRICLQIIMPLITPALAVFAITVLEFTWNTFLWPLIITGTETTTLSVGLSKAIASNLYSLDYGLLFAAASYSLIPMIVLFLFFQRYFKTGLIIGALK